MEVKAKREAEISQRYAHFLRRIQKLIVVSCSFDELSRLIVENGGKVVDLGEPKLTHVVIDKRDISRRAELMKRTSKYVAHLYTYLLLTLSSIQGRSDEISLSLTTYKHASMKEHSWMKMVCTRKSVIGVRTESSALRRIRPLIPQ